MTDTITIRLERPVASAGIADDYAADAAGCEWSESKTDSWQTRLTQDLQNQQAEISGLCLTLKSLVDKFNHFCENAFASYKEEIVRLSVEIARKILMRKVEDGDYQIEAIVQEALKNAPARQDVTVHLSPSDFERCQKIQQDDPGVLAGIKFVCDPAIGRAECLVETPKGIVQSLINEHLERIAKALKKAE